LNPTTHVAPQLLAAGLAPAAGLPGYEQLFKFIFECSAAGMLVLDLDGRCVCVNQAFCDLIGYTAEEIMARTIGRDYSSR
jgi:PAS domain-containing protein